MRAIEQLVLGLGVSLLADGGIGNGGVTATGSLNGKGGDGGDGVVSLEDGQGPTAAALQAAFTIVRGELFAQALSAGSATMGAATSTSTDAGDTPDYTQASVQTVTATVSGTASVQL